MYIDDTIIAGLLAVLMILLFFVGLGIYVLSDIRKHASAKNKAE